MSYTPGPWRLKRDKDGEEFSFVESEKDGRPIASLGFLVAVGEVEDRANARLIVAAPEIFAALKETARHLEEDTALHPDLHPVGKCPVLDMARAAIAKAEATP
jgi:hypothetical protein